MRGNGILICDEYGLTDRAKEMLGVLIENARESMGKGVLCGLKLTYDGTNAHVVWQSPPGDAPVTFWT